MSSHTLTPTHNVTSSFTPVNGGVLQRQCACGQQTIAGAECVGCKEKSRTTLQRHVAGQAESNPVPPIVYEVLRSPGQPLDAATRTFMEPRFGRSFSKAPVASQTKLSIGPFDDASEREANATADGAIQDRLPRVDVGYDFSEVRVHTDAPSAESARLMNAHAYTIGHDIVFGEGQYAPNTSHGKHLLAHELTHVVQQRGPTKHTRSSTIQRQPVDCTNQITGVKEPRNPTEEVIEAHNLAIGYSRTALSQIEALKAGMPVPLFVESSAARNFGSPTASALSMIANRFTGIINRLSKGSKIYHCNTAGSQPCHICDQPHPENIEIWACTPCPSTGEFTRLCPPFFQVGSVARALTLVHEAVHAAGGCGDVSERDGGYPGPNPVTNAVSYEQFARHVALELSPIPYRRHTPTGPG
jgi:hypothetical protein